MKKRRWSDGWFAAALVLTALHCAAQDSFRYRAQVDTPHEPDFYRIVLSPEVVARSKTDLSDLTVGISAMQAGRRPVLTANRTNSQTRRRIPALEHLSTVLLLLIYFSVKMVGAIGAKKGPHDRV